MSGHAAYALALKAGSEKAREDYALGVNSNPFHDEASARTYDSVQTLLRNQTECLKEHDQTVCCVIHNQHVDGRRAKTWLA
jgi:hypothetical protein